MQCDKLFLFFLDGGGMGDEPNAPSPKRQKTSDSSTDNLRRSSRVSHPPNRFVCFIDDIAVRFTSEN